MHLFYAYGSGLGHLNRILSFIKVEKLAFSKCIVLTNSKHTHFLPGEIQWIHYADSVFKNHELFAKTFLQIIEAYAVTSLVVDVFPCGFYGELKNINVVAVPKTLLGRILNPLYFEQYGSPKYDELIVFEKGVLLENYNYSSVRHFTIHNTFQFSDESISLQKPFFFIIHSEPETEVIQLFKWAKLYQKNKEHIYIQTHCDLVNFHDKEVTVIHNKLPLQTLLEHSEKIFTACGFNLFHATEPYRTKHYSMPFKRRYDNQFMRKREG